MTNFLIILVVEIPTIVRSYTKVFVISRVQKFFWLNFFTVFFHLLLNSTFLLAEYLVSIT